MPRDFSDRSGGRHCSCCRIPQAGPDRARPSRTIHGTASTNIRLSRPTRRLAADDGRRHSLQLKDQTVRSSHGCLQKTALNHASPQWRIPRVNAARSGSPHLRSGRLSRTCLPLFQRVDPAIPHRKHLRMLFCMPEPGWNRHRDTIAAATDTPPSQWSAASQPALRAPAEAKPVSPVMRSPTVATALNPAISTRMLGRNRRRSSVQPRQ